MEWKCHYYFVYFVNPLHSLLFFLSDIRHAGRHQLGAGELVLCCLGNCLFFFLFFSFFFVNPILYPFSLGCELTLFFQLPDRNFSPGRLECPSMAIPQMPYFLFALAINQSINQSINRLTSEFSISAPLRHVKIEPETYVNVIPADASQARLWRAVRPL